MRGNGRTIFLSARFFYRARFPHLSHLCRAEIRYNVRMRKILFSLLCLTLCVIALSSLRALARAAPSISAPVLKWQNGGCQTTWCRTGWYASPVVADLDGDQQAEVIWTDSRVVVVNGADGSAQWIVNNPGGGRGWPSVVVGDVDQNGSLEIVTAHANGYLAVWNGNGAPFGNFPKQAQQNELRSLAVDDVDADGDLEILVCATRSENQWFMYEHNGAVRAGFPVHSPDSNVNGYAAGCYNENVGLADLDGDGRAEMIGPNDTHYVVGYNDDGTPLRAHSMYGQINSQNKVWARVGFHYSHAVDLKGYADCGTEHRPNFADSAPSFADVNNDGVLEIIIVGNTYNCGTSPYTNLFHSPYLLRLDRTRWAGNGFDWTDLPTPDANAAPLSEAYDTIETVMPNPVAADLDHDGYKEILYSSYDGRLHAYWLDKTEHGAWPYAVTKQNENFIRFSSEPVVVDLDNDGQAEVIVTTWTQKESNAAGQLLILSSMGNLLHAVDLPRSDDDWDGALAAPTIAEIDGDADYEIVIGTAHTGIVAYDLPNSANARILWGTGRGNALRNGRAPVDDAPAPTATHTPTPTRTGAPPPTMTATSTPAACAGAPAAPQLKRPKDARVLTTQQVKLRWRAETCATRYQVQVRRGSAGGVIVDSQTALQTPAYTTKTLKRNRNYFWNVRACNGDMCSGWSAARSFRIVAP